MPTRTAGRRLLALPLLGALLSTGLLFGTSTSADAMSRAHRDRQIHRAVEIGLDHIGDPYVYGAAGPGAFDCSGLTSYAFGRVGVSLPRTSADQYRDARHIKKRNLQRGDLIFFHSGSSVYHVAIFLKRKDHHVILLHSPYPGSHVQRDPIWTSQWWAGTTRLRRH
ncbi:MAG: C40 family peptidase [Nocardioidaceae bacterium]